MKRRFRLTRSTDFQRVRQLGKSQAHPLIVLIAIPNQQQSSRFGVVVGNGVGKAVQRNRARRRLRAALHAYLACIPPGWDIVLIARRLIVQATFDQIQSALASLLKRAGLCQDSNEGSGNTFR